MPCESLSGRVARLFYAQKTETKKRRRARYENY